MILKQLAERSRSHWCAISRWRYRNYQSWW